MSLPRQTAVVAGALVFAAALAVACSNDDGTDTTPCTVSPAFDLSVRAVPGPLPADTTIFVEYGSGDETYRVDTQDAGHEIMLCKQVAADGGDAGAAVAEVHCDLWTQAAAKVTVSATGYPTVADKQLVAVPVGKCFKTVPVEIVLGDQDAAP